MTDVLSRTPVTIYEEVIREVTNGVTRIVGPHFVLATDGDDQWARSAKMLLTLRACRLTPGRLALIGGGLGIFLRLLDPGWIADVYESEPTLAEYCPPPHVFKPGDWHTTLLDSYIAIIYDVDDTPDVSALSAHLLPRGVLISSVGVVVTSDGTKP